MCGIAGFNWQDEDLIRSMTDTLVHRGPDQHGAYTTPDVSLGHRRLSIIDLSDHGRQPMGNEDGTIQIVFNGEIYNFQEIREDLISKGHRFQSHSDTEVIIHAYEEYGLDAVHTLRGMFAFALWDNNIKRLWLVRDRIGIKPLYYYLRDGKLLFASEIKAILQTPYVSRTMNEQAFYDYMGFEFVPAPATMFRDIHKLPAGYQLIWEKGDADLRSYWDLSYAPRELKGRSRHDLASEVRDSMNDAVKSHLISDVPLGVFLSGGLDSSALAAFMRQHVKGRLQTFTIGYPDKSFSELDYAKQVADYLDTEHNILMIDDITPEDIENSLWHFDEPMTDLSSIPLMKLCGKARRDVTVCLSGEGGDEVFAGYDRFKASKLNRWYSMIPSPLRRGLVTPLVMKLPDQQQKKGAFNLLKRFVEGSALPADGRHLRWQYFLNNSLSGKLFKEDFLKRISDDAFRHVRAHEAKCDAEDAVNRELYLDTRFMMSDSVLMKVDRMSMTHSLEVRVPLLDHKVVELAASLPGKWKLRGLRTKDIFREALRGLLPDDIVYRGKQGFSLPVKNLLRDQMKNYMTDLLRESNLLREYTHMNYVEQLIEEHVSRKHNHNHVLWGLMNMAIWHNKFIESAHVRK